MLTHRSTHDELRREGEARTRRSQEVTKDLSGWKHRWKLPRNGLPNWLSARKARKKS